MKKATSMILTLVICLSLCACGGSDSEAETNNNSSQQGTEQRNGQVSDSDKAITELLNIVGEYNSINIGEPFPFHEKTTFTLVDVKTCSSVGDLISSENGYIVDVIFGIEANTNLSTGNRAFAERLYCITAYKEDSEVPMNASARLYEKDGSYVDYMEIIGKPESLSAGDIIRVHICFEVDSSTTAIAVINEVADVPPFYYCYALDK